MHTYRPRKDCRQNHKSQLLKRNWALIRRRAEEQERLRAIGK